MRRIGFPRVLPFVLALAGAACGLDESGLLPLDASLGHDSTLPDATPEETTPPADAKPHKDHAVLDVADGGGAADGDASPSVDGSADASVDAPVDSPFEDAADALVDSATDGPAADALGEAAVEAGADVASDAASDVVGDAVLETGSDAAAEASSDASVDAPALDGGADAASDAAVGYACEGGTTGDCLSGCPGAPVSCLFCGVLGGQAGFCGPSAQLCSFDNPPFGYVGCTCGSTGDCPAGDQICVTLGCRSCGEPGTNNNPCKGGGKCHESTATCK